MIRGIILYYLNIKPTHGYEIQQFIQLSGIDQWTKIQSGSIYYALGKLEKEKNIAVLREERTGSRVRKIFQITAQGRETLYEEMQQELAAPLFQIGSSKFITSPILATLSEADTEKIIRYHIKELQDTLAYWRMWGDKKSADDQHNLTNLSFQMSINSLNQQIAWHEELLAHLDYYRKEAAAMGHMIFSFDADSMKELEVSSGKEEQLKLLNDLKNIVADDPQKALENINELIKQIKSQS